MVSKNSNQRSYRRQSLLAIIRSYAVVVVTFLAFLAFIFLIVYIERFVLGLT